MHLAVGILMIVCCVTHLYFLIFNHQVIAVKELFLVILLFLCSLANGQFKGAYKKGDTLNVLTISGVNLRENPSSASNKIATIIYGSKIQVVDDNLRQTKFRVEELKEFFIEGYWVKVKFRDQIGYLFDGYLSKFPILDYKDTAIYEERLDFHFLKENFKTIGKRKALKKYHDCKVTVDNDCFCAFEDKFEDGISYSEDFCFEAGSQNILKIKGATLVEMYLFAKALAQSWQMGISISYDTKNKGINIDTTEDGAGCGGIIQEKN